jgi:hypothetical protein
MLCFRKCNKNSLLRKCGVVVDLNKADLSVWLTYVLLGILLRLVALHHLRLLRGHLHLLRLGYVHQGSLILLATPKLELGEVNEHMLKG